MSAFFQSIRLRIRDIQHYFTTIKSLTHLLWQVTPVFFIVSCSLTFLAGLLPMASILISSNLLQILVQATQSQEKTDFSTTLIFLLALMAGTNFLTQIFQRMNATIQRLHRTRVINHVQILIAQKAAEIDLACFEDSEFHNRMRTASNEASYRIPMFLDRLLMTCSKITTFCSLSLILLFWHSWILPIILIASLAPFWVSTHFGRMRVSLIKKRSETERRKSYLNTMLLSEQTAKEIRLFGLQNFLVTALCGLIELIYKQDREIAFRELRASAFFMTFLLITQPALIAFAAFQVLQRAITIGQFSFYTQSIIQLETEWTQLLSTQSGLHEDNLFAAHLFEFLATQPNVEAKRPQSRVYDAKITQTPNIEFQNVSFFYPGTENSILENISFVIHPGEAVALLGENGAGKTTLVKLLTGLYEPTHGRILLDGIDIQTLERNELRAYLSVIFQDYTIYHFSIRENVGVGQVGYLSDFSRIEKAAQDSGLDRVIAKLPDGYETILGRSWENGHELSGGQRQLIALARALLRDAPILILDEPSAALDIYTETHFFQHLLEHREAGQLQTVIFISHRFTTLHRADRILVLENGRLIEQGTHTELITQGGAYTKMCNLQAAQYNR